MNAKIPGSVIVLVLLASLFTESESYAGNGMVGRKRSVNQVSKVTLHHGDFAVILPKLC